MQKRRKDTSLLRKTLTVSILLCFIFFLLVFIYQYLQYKRIEDRLTAAYSTTYSQSTSIYKLFSTFSEADNLFRLYTVDYSEENYNAYKDKLDTIKVFNDSIASLPMENNPLLHSGTDLQLSENYATEFASLKKDIDQLVFYASDSLTVLHEATPLRARQRISRDNADSVMNKILQDTVSMNVSKDTVVREKGGLIKRIFNTKSDTLISTDTHKVLNNQQIDIVHKNIEYLIQTNERAYQSNLQNLQLTMAKMRDKERDLVISNYTLLHKLKNGIAQLRQLELDKIRQAEAQDFAVYKENFTQFGRQLIAAVIIMLLMVILIVYHHYKTSSYERKLSMEREYAEKIAEEKTSILANVSHEVRTPINSLRGIIDLLKSDNSSDTIDREIIQTVDHDISVINSTLNDILSLSKLEADSLEIKYEHFSPYQLLEEIIQLHKYQAKTKGLAYEYENKIPTDVQVYSNIFRIKQVVSNLISNAIKYTAKGSVKVETSFSEWNGRHTLLVNVVDTGVGIPADQHEQVFRKYYVADSKNRSGGFGLGLYISQILSEQINGKINVSSKLGQGSTFTFKLPIDNKHIRMEDNTNYTVSDIPDDMHIAIIDDSRISLFFMQQLLKTKKNIHFFSSSEQAWNHIQSHKIDLVITDLLMPEMDGWQLLHAIKSSPSTSHIRVLVSTAEPMLLEDKSERRYSFDGIVDKPIQENDIVKKILKS